VRRETWTRERDRLGFHCSVDPVWVVWAVTTHAVRECRYRKGTDGGNHRVICAYVQVFTGRDGVVMCGVHPVSVCRCQTRQCCPILL
jgi:hypothetical protein